MGRARRRNSNRPRDLLSPSFVKSTTEDRPARSSRLAALSRRRSGGGEGELHPDGGDTFLSNRSVMAVRARLSSARRAAIDGVRRRAEDRRALPPAVTEALLPQPSRARS